MSLITTPKTSYDPSDGILDTDMNEIGENLISLEGSKYENGDDAVFNNVSTPNASISTLNSTTINTGTVNTGIGPVECFPMNQGVQTTDTVSFASILPTGASTLGSWALTTTPILIPRGIYSISNSLGAAVYSIISMQKTPGVWVSISTGDTGNSLSTYGDLIFSDGVNFRIAMASGTDTVSYRKF